jgi:hemoglobin-like flavoprotein
MPNDEDSTPLYHGLPGEPGGPADLPDAAVDPSPISGGPVAQPDLEPAGGHSFDKPRPSDSSSRIMFEPAPEQPPARDRCPVCRGTGWKMTTADFLRESLALIEGKAAEAVDLFYQRLFTVAPHLEPLFPNLVEQRDRLVGALVALGTTYDPTNPAAMEALQTKLAAMGRAHSNFRRPDGTEQGATLDEYMAVKSVLLPTIIDVAEEAGVQWLPVYSAAWSEAYDFAAAHMMVAAFAAPQSFARTVRS